MPLSSQLPCDLSAILEIWPEHDHECAGIAKGAGRRCKLTTNKLNRSIACSLLEEGSALLNSGEECIDDILTDLAPRTLCVRWHQYQASGLVSQWKRKVDKFVQQRQAVSRRERRERHSFSSRQSTPEPRTSGSSTRVHIQQNNILLNVESLYVFSNTPAPRETSYPANTSQSSRAAMSSVAAIPSGESRRLQATSPSAIPTPSRMIENRATPRDEPTETTDTANTQRRILPLPTRRTNSTITRRPIEGECGICYLPLLNDDEDDTNSSDNSISGSETSGSTSTTSTSEPLVWCKAQCGNNYHKSCMDPWIKCCADNSRAATCPTCRATWRRQ